ncbi:YaiI/YqxD family protein [Lacicoccus qingdaonensis]|uniref:UPF0178 protein SAMN05216216_103178 n=1 Tax=Lacicoccus qingdaonensis TaxID=576118 RepID=A0A1G9C1G5_9BACL|nr:YaiI/YqxD family protein [Salinicoccus qingdaonensis]SDK45324.1 hypothetical protein SAMN05216216_103178 [Salinicoccus qingdaonensis]
MKIIVDADACPVKDIIFKETEGKDIPVTLVSSISHFSNQDVPAHVETIYVDAGRDAADFKIVAFASKDDIVVTQDYGLASLLLPKGVRVLHHKGFEYDDMNIDHLLHTRHISAAIRQGGGRTKGPKPFSKEDGEAFRNLFRDKIM